MRALIAAALLGLAVLLPAAPALAAKPTEVGVCHEAHGRYVYVVVNPHALKHGHTEARGDVLGLSKDECLALNPA